jgi:HJR/Mrr/RecB family endonuclease
LDIAYPGFLSASLKAFTEDYKPDDIDALRRLRADLMEPSDGALPVMMRRMKADHVEGLPAKHVHRRPETMPPEQAKTYADVVENAQLGRIGMLEALHGMRGASLHPVDPQQGRGIDANRYCDMSARLRTTFVILSEIQRRGEKALIFLESLEMQALLAVIIKQRFGLKLEPLRINGNLVGKARLDAVEAFEDPAKGGFDVMILSPKAGGVGLNITAANHVIHLSRWWNPAVEDQCTDRAYRIGQEKDVHVYYPQAIHPSSELKSFDLIVDELLERKRRLSADLLIAPVLPGYEGELYSATVGAAPISPNRREAGDPDVSIEEIDRMEPKAFEDWVLQRAQRLGYRSNRTPVTGDAGADGIIVHAAGERIFVQCKHRQPETRCDDEAIIDLLKARESYDGSDRLIAITNAAGFTTKAKERADRFGVILIARDRVAAWPHGCL